MMCEELQSLFDQLAQENHVSVEEIMQDLKERIDAAWEDPDEKYADLRRFFKDGKPCPAFFLFAFHHLQNLNDQVQDIIEEVYLTEIKEGTSPSMEVAERLDADQIEDPIETFLAILHCLQSNTLIVKMLKRLSKQKTA